MVTSPARGQGASPPLDASASLRLGQVHLDARSQRLTYLNETARQLHKEGVPFLATEPTFPQLRKLTGEPAEAGDLPLVITSQTGKPAEATFELTRAGKPVCRVAWSASPVTDVGRRLIGVVASVCCSPPPPDWLALAGLAHDLRNPLHAIGLLLSAKNLTSLNVSQQNELLKTMHSSAERALKVGKDLLEWCRGPGQQGRPPASGWFSLEPFLAGLVQEHVPATMQKRLALLVDLEAAREWEINTDQVRLGRLLSNLLANAVRYTSRGQIAVRAAWRYEPEGRMLALSVVDTGTGISPEEQESIFHPYERGHAGKGDSTGSGLGLAVVDLLVKELGLRLEVYSEFNRGSTFDLLLPEELLRPALGTVAR
jgi:anti-sigma regulatory factor (Ser/Thr protein kinase)